MNEEMTQKIQEKFQSWTLHGMTSTEKVEYLKGYLSHQIALTLFGDPNLPQDKRVGDNVYELAVEETLFQDVQEALEQIDEIPAVFMPDPTQAEMFNANFKEYCKTRMVRPIPLELYNYPFDLTPIPAESLFINVHTSTQYARVETQQWLQASGLVEYMKSKGFSFTPSYEETRMLVFISQLLEVLAVKSDQTKQVQLATNDAQMFRG